MAWNHAKARSARYSRDHRAQRAAAIRQLEQAGVGRCAEPVCVKRSRTITPGMDLHLSHDPTGQVVIGLSHRACNLHEAARRGNRLRYHPPRPKPARARSSTDW